MRYFSRLPKNQKFDIAVAVKKKTIPLYDIPLSAGSGEKIFGTDVPFEEYETDVENGDFALKISGDSMEPEIPNGSIVVVKKDCDVPDGITGAFFLNGEVYCKKLLHKDGKAFLCSVNSKYPPLEIHDEDNLQVYGKIIKVI